MTKEFKVSDQIRCLMGLYWDESEKEGKIGPFGSMQVFRNNKDDRCAFLVLSKYAISDDQASELSTLIANHIIGEEIWRSTQEEDIDA